MIYDFEKEMRKKGFKKICGYWCSNDLAYLYDVLLVKYEYVMIHFDLYNEPLNPPRFFLYHRKKKSKRRSYQIEEWKRKMCWFIDPGCIPTPVNQIKIKENTIKEMNEKYNIKL